MRISRLFRPVAVACGFVEANEDRAMEQYYCEAAEECAHCGSRTTGQWKDLLAYFFLGIAVSICLHSARL